MATYDTSFYTKQYDEYAAEQDKTAKKRVEQSDAAYNNKLKEAYVTRMQNQKNLNQNLARAGIRGGVSETANLNLATNYEKTRNSLNTEKAQASADIFSEAESNKFAMKQTTDAAAQSYVEQRQAEDRQIEQTKAENEAAKERENNINFWTSKYSTYYSTDSLNKAYKEATTIEEKAIIYARIGFLKAQKKGY